MGPLVPEIISSDMSLILALFLGFGFGFALEQAGFSTSRKLVGLFYGYDFTVLRVFFTAGVTAMIGVLVLEHLGLLDMNLVYVNPTFLRSALAGGLVMGAGFIIGGFCPGTSICAAATGKLDAMVFVGGALIGILGFTELYPLLKTFYTADNRGALRIDESLGLSPVLFALLLTLTALGAFALTAAIEAKVTKKPLKLDRPARIRYAAFAAAPLAVLLLIAVTPNRTERIQSAIAEAERQKKCKFKEISSDRLADELMNHAFEINLIDVRPKKAFAAGHLPLAISIPLEEIFHREFETIFKQQHKRNVFYADDVKTAKKACLSAKFIGTSENLVLNETMQQFQAKVLDSRPPPPGAGKQALTAYTFRSKAAAAIKKLEAALSHLGQPVKKKLVKAKGGCS